MPSEKIKSLKTDARKIKTSLQEKHAKRKQTEKEFLESIKGKLIELLNQIGEHEKDLYENHPEEIARRRAVYGAKTY